MLAGVCIPLDNWTAPRDRRSVERRTCRRYTSPRRDNRRRRCRSMYRLNSLGGTSPHRRCSQRERLRIAAKSPCSTDRCRSRCRHCMASHRRRRVQSASSCSRCRSPISRPPGPMRDEAASSRGGTSVRRRCNGDRLADSAPAVRSHAGAHRGSGARDVGATDVEIAASLSPSGFDRVESRSIVHVDHVAADVTRRDGQCIADQLLALPAHPDCAALRRRERGCVLIVQIRTAQSTRSAPATGVELRANAQGPTWTARAARRAGVGRIGAGTAATRRAARPYRAAETAASRSPAANATLSATTRASRVPPCAAAGAALTGSAAASATLSAARAARVTSGACSAATRAGQPAGAGAAAGRAPSAVHSVAAALKLNVAGTASLKRPGAQRACAHASGTGCGRARLARGTTSPGTASGLSASTALAHAPSRAASSRAPAAVALARHRAAPDPEAKG
jgi:hypothetical protein